mgnify:CR=1 FL=1
MSGAGVSPEALPARLPADGPFYAYRSREMMSDLHREITAGLAPGLHEIDRETGPAAARDLAARAGVPILAGSPEPLASVADAKEIARELHISETGIARWLIDQGLDQWEQGVRPEVEERAVRLEPKLKYS